MPTPKCSQTLRWIKLNFRTGPCISSLWLCHCLHFSLFSEWLHCLSSLKQETVSTQTTDQGQERELQFVDFLDRKKTPTPARTIGYSTLTTCYFSPNGYITLHLINQREKKSHSKKERKKRKKEGRQKRGRKKAHPKKSENWQKPSPGDQTKFGKRC